MPNKRLISSCIGVFSDDTFLSGVQAIGVNPQEGQSSIRDYGRSQPFSIFSNKPVVELTISRVIGNLSDFFYQPTTKNTYTGSYILKSGNIGLCGWDASPLKQHTIDIYYGNDDLPYLGSDSGTSIGKLTAAHCLITQIEYTMNVGGFVNESISFIANNLTRTFSSAYPSLPSFNESAQLLRRQNILVRDSGFVLPTEVSQTFDNGFQAGSDVLGKYVLQDITVSAKISYQEFIDTGKWRGSDTLSEQNKWKYITSPIDVSASFKGLARDIFSHNINVSDVNFMTSPGVPDRQIRIVAQLGSNYYVWDLGSKNKLSGISKDGDNAGEGNMYYTFEYINLNNDFVPYIDTSVHTLTSIKF